MIGNVDIEQIKRDLASPSQGTRVHAMQMLLLGAQKNPELRAAALPLFHHAIQTESDPHTAIFAARGIECAAGPDEARAAWLALLSHSQPKMIERAAIAVHDPVLLPILEELATQRPEAPIRIAAIRTLGRSKNAAVLPTLLKCLASPDDVRADTVEALGDLGQPTAIPYLQPLLHNTTPAWQEDNHGPMLRICDLAKQSIARLGSQSPAPSINHHAPPLPPGRPKVIYAAYFPFIAAVAELPWIAILVIVQLSPTGKFELDQAQTHRFDLLCMIPALVGIAIGIFVLLRGGLHRWFDRIFLFIGLAACSLFIASFGWEFFY